MNDISLIQASLEYGNGWEGGMIVEARVVGVLLFALSPSPAHAMRTCWAEIPMVENLAAPK